MAKAKELAQAPERVRAMRPPEAAEQGPARAPRQPVFSTEARSNGAPAAARAAEHTPAGAPARARSATRLQQGVGNARMGRMMTAGGAGKLPAATKGPLEHTFGVSLDFVEVHTGNHAAEANRRAGARAFAHGHSIYLGPGESPQNLELMAHEVAHVLQQQGGGATAQKKSASADGAYEREADRASAAALRSEPITIQERTGSGRPQFFGLGEALDSLAEKANMLPGFRMFTIVLGANPITMSTVERSAANIFRAVVEFIPGGGLIVQVADAYGAFDKVAAWVEPQIAAAAGAASSIKKALSDLLDSLHLSDLLDLGGVWERAKTIFTSPVDRVLGVAKGLIAGILALFRQVILAPLAGLAAKTQGWDLLTAVLGKNPITGETVPRTAETLVPGFLKLVGEEETWNNIKKANALARCWTWFQGALATVVGFVQAVPSLFLATLQQLVLEDLLVLTRAFGKVASAFGSFVARFTTWAGQALWSLLQIIFEVLAPAALPYLKKVGASFQKILKDPMSFVGNLVKAGKQGFLQFASNIGTHLKNSLINWLTGSLPGVYIPRSFDFREIVHFALSVLGLTWANIREKLVKAMGEPAVKGMETGFALVKTLVTQGPAAAWEQIKEQLGNLQDMVLQGIIGFVTETVVKKAIAKIVAWLIPGAGFIDAVITIYDTVLVFIDKLKNIIQVATAFLDSMMNIANGVIGAAANKVESTLAGLLTLSISFLAGVVGLGRVADKIMDVLNTKVRAPISKALDFVVTWIVNGAKKVLGALFGSKDGKGNDPGKQAGLAALDTLNQEYAQGVDSDELTKALSRVKTKYPVFTVLRLQTTKDGGYEYYFEMSPGKTKAGPGSKRANIKLYRPSGFRVATKTTLQATYPEQHKQSFKRPILRVKQARRHIIPSQEVLNHTAEQLNGKSISEALKMLAAKGYPKQGSKLPLTNESVQVVAMELIRAFFNDVENLWVGNASENSSLQDTWDFPQGWTEEKMWDLLIKLRNRYML